MPGNEIAATTIDTLIKVAATEGKRLFGMKNSPGWAFERRTWREFPDPSSAQQQACDEMPESGRESPLGRDCLSALLS